ncbi:alpha-N-acetylneuraminide alpha-2,8-sialyltransferase-like [Saccoglossus kowalevskii]|uniref:Alpha-N-acetylneuraminide alpha-2,8-sialyltransferase-like n=1 Tax=Saccoglossus kowalevskii TaxID=10224 RepID=A0ABM0MK13_SACKO|nr:PREDICTED: alpha-N-acetylneuraminide alpha-2,8-sialyltransferase-like [Saccoglossus kowalevskii]
MYKRCSIVGNGGILKDSGCGEEIDRADYVLRANLPSIRNFTDDAGKKTNFTTFNPSMISRRYNYDRTAFNKDLNEYQGILMFSGTRNYTDFHAHVKQNTTLNVFLLDYTYLYSLKELWKFNKSVSSGLMLFSLALTHCEEMHLFGFWPFDTDEKDEVLIFVSLKEPVADQIIPILLAKSWVKNHFW